MVIDVHDIIVSLGGEVVFKQVFRDLYVVSDVLAIGMHVDHARARV